MSITVAVEGETFGSFDGLRFVLDCTTVLGGALAASVGARGRSHDVAVSIYEANEKVTKGRDQRDELEEGERPR